MKELNFENFRILGLYVFNRIDYSKFLKLMEITNDNYAMEKWQKFRSNPFGFMIEYELFFNNILKTIIEKENYKG